MSMATRQLELWEVWKTRPTNNNLETLLNSVNPIIRTRINQFRAAEVPTPALELEANRLAIQALYNYDPGRAALGTHIYNSLRPLNRYVGERQNIGKIPENRIFKIRQFKTARDDLSNFLERDPTLEELGDNLKWPLKEVERMEAELSGSRATDIFSVETIKPMNRERIVQQMLYYELAPDEKIVYEYLMGIGGKPKLTTNEIARKLKVSPMQIVRRKQNIARQFQKYSY